MDLAKLETPTQWDTRQQLRFLDNNSTRCPSEWIRAPEFEAFAKQAISRTDVIVTSSRTVSINNEASRANFANDFDKSSPSNFFPTVISAGSRLKLSPPIEVEVKDSVRNRDAYETAKREGRIYITPYTNATLRVHDTPAIQGYTGNGTCQVVNWSKTQPTGSHVGCGRTLYDFPSGSYQTTPGILNNEWAIPATYRVYKDVDAVSAIAGTEAFFEDLLREVNDKLWTIPFDSGLVTAGTAELNSGYWDIATELGELPETIKMIYGAMKAILNKYLEVRGKVKTLRANSISSGSISTDIASLWMGYRYGIQPIVYSISDALDYLERQGVFRTVRQGLNLTETIVTPVGPVTFSGRDRYWGKVRVDPLNNLTDLKANVLSTAWELVPLSFVIDWVFNVGDLLSSLTGPSGATEVKHSYSRRMGGIIPLTLRGSTVYADVQYYRSIPINPLAHIGLTADPNMTWKRVLDALSLSWFQVKSDFRRKL